MAPRGSQTSSPTGNGTGHRPERAVGKTQRQARRCGASSVGADHDWRETDRLRSPYGRRKTSRRTCKSGRLSSGIRIMVM